MPQIFYIAGIACLSMALLFNLLTTISIPTLHGLDFARINFDRESSDTLTQIQYGVWGYCQFFIHGKPDCTDSKTGWETFFERSETSEVFVMTAAWTRGLAIHPFVLCLNALALAFATLKHDKGPILASLASLVVVFFTVLAFAIDIAFVARLHHVASQATVGNMNVIPGPAFWLTFMSLLLVLGAGATSFLGHRKNRAAGGDPTMYYPSTSKPGLLGRFF